MSKEEILQKIREALFQYDSEAVKSVSQELIDKGISPLEGIDVLTKTAREIGDKFGRNEIFLSELMLAADSLMSGLNILISKVPKDQVQKAGSVVIGTVRGDIHDIGKNIVIAMLSASGFEVMDLGKDVAISTFAEMAEKQNADIVAISALMSTSIPLQKEIIDYFKALGIRDKYKIMIGGGPTSQEFADEIGADGYASDAASAAKKALELVGKD